MCVKFGYSENIQDVENYIKEQKGKRKKKRNQVWGVKPPKCEGLNPPVHDPLHDLNNKETVIEVSITILI